MAIAAPGGTISHPLYSTADYNPQNNLYASDAGTSMAAPLAAGTIALGMSAYPHIPWQTLISDLALSGSPQGALQGEIRSGRELDALDYLHTLQNEQHIQTMVVAEATGPGPLGSFSH